MAQSNIGIRFNIDVSQGKSQVDQLSKSVEGLRDKIAEATKAEDWRAVAELSQAMNNAASARGQIINQTQQAEKQAQQQVQDGSFFQGNSWILFQNSLNQITQGIIKSMDAALNAAKQRASGDYTGAALAEHRAPREIAGQAIGSGIGALGFLGGPLLGALTMGIGGEIGKFIGGIETRKLEEDLAYSQQYKNAFSSIDALNQLYGGAINNKSAGENNSYGLSMYSRAAEKTAGTGLSTQDFIAAMKEVGTYGVKSEAQALHMAQDQAKWARFSGAELSTIQKYSGTAYRYAGEANGASTAYAGMLAQNMGKGQYSEFLNSMSRIMEEGISKGFVRSSKEIAGNMAMLYKLSGNSPLWQGEQGAQRLSQMNNALANATNLENVEHFIDFGVAKNVIENMSPTQLKALETGPNGKKTGFVNLEDDRANTMQLLSMGFRPEILAGQFEAITQLDTGSNGKLDVFSAMQRYKSRGFNDLGAAQIVNMMQESGSIDKDTGKWKWKDNHTSESVSKYIEDLRTNPTYQSDSERLQTTLNRLNNSLVNIGEVKFNTVEMKMLQDQKIAVDNILAHLTKNDPPPPVDLSTMSIHDVGKLSSQVYYDAKKLDDDIGLVRLDQGILRMFEGGRGNRGTATSAAQPSFFNINEPDDLAAYNKYKGFRDGSNVLAHRAFIDSLRYIEQLSPEQRSIANSTDAINRGIQKTTDAEVHKLLQNIIDELSEVGITLNVNMP